MTPDARATLRGLTLLAAFNYGTAHGMTVVDVLALADRLHDEAVDKERGDA